MEVIGTVVNISSRMGVVSNCGCCMVVDDNSVLVNFNSELTTNIS